MSGIWDALTLQGKLVLLAGVGVVILIFAMVFRSGSADDGSPPAAVVKTPTVTAQRTPTPGAAGVVTTATRTTTTTSNAAASPTAVASATSAAAATATIAPSSPTPEIVVPPTATAVFVPPPPPPPEPTATTAPLPPAPSPTIAAVSCVVLATVSNTAPFVGDVEVVTGQLSCGKPIAGATMQALFSYSNTTGTCNGTSDGEGRASCSVRLLEVPPNVFVSVSVCFKYLNEVTCGKTGFTPQ